MGTASSVVLERRLTAIVIGCIPLAVAALKASNFVAEVVVEVVGVIFSVLRISTIQCSSILIRRINTSLMFSND